MKHADLRLIPAAACIWILAVLGVMVSTAAAVAACAVIVALALSAIMLAGGSRAVHVLFAHLGILVLAGALLFPALQRHGQTDHLLAEAAEDALVVELNVVAGADPAPPASGPAWSRSGIQVMTRTVRGPATLGRHDVQLPASLPVLLRAAPRAADGLSQARDGDTIRVRGVLSGSGNLTVLTASEAVPVATAGVSGAMQAARQQLRHQARAATSHLPADEAALVRGMTSGDTTGMGEATEETMRRAGISHLVAVSGANIALVLAAVLGVLLLCGVRRRPRLLVAGAVLAGYVWLVGDEPSVQRAATMATPLLVARFAGVRASAVASLALTVALWSVLDPVTAASVGFLLSALATAAILVAAPPLATVITDASGGRLGRPLTLVVAVPLVAQLICTPLLVLLTPEISLWAVPVNILVGPLVAPTTVLGLMALVIGTIWPAAAVALNTAAAGGAHLVLLIARAADSLPGSRIAVPEGATGAVLALAVVAGVAAAIAARRSPAVRWISAALLVVALAPSIGRIAPIGSSPPWLVAVCAVGQGDAVLLRSHTPSGTATVLIDTGPEPAPLRRCLDRLEITRIDLLVLTHPHADHTGGLGALTGARAPAGQWICPIPEATDDVVPDVPTGVATTGDTWQQHGLVLEVLWPVSADGAISASARESGAGEGDNANDCSIALSATWAGGTRLVSLGDLEPAAQQELAGLDPGPADIVKVAHHGSRRQSPQLYEHLDADLALITVGAENTFGHPTPTLLDLLAASDTRVVRTDEDGTVILPTEDPAAPRSVGPAR
ncbi:ComEC/Rec2 family competence protein [Brachybacterium sp. GCM10030268]|uniref:ComEC/Rec2 family competence protein n=1 Tax=Brachybacterium sp. GCM10030268 TaxID=3273382 RepID=UPI00360BC688